MIIKYDSMINPVVMELWPSPHWATSTSTQSVTKLRAPARAHQRESPPDVVALQLRTCHILRSSCWPKLLEFWVLNHPGIFFLHLHPCSNFSVQKAILIFDLEEITINHEKSSHVPVFLWSSHPIFPLIPLLKKNGWLYDFMITIWLFNIAMVKIHTFLSSVNHM